MSNRTSKIWDVPVERFKEIIKNSRSYNNAAANLGFSHGGNNKTVKKIPDIAAIMIILPTNS